MAGAQPENLSDLVDIEIEVDAEEQENEAVGLVRKDPQPPPPFVEVEFVQGKVTYIKYFCSAPLGMSFGTVKTLEEAPMVTKVEVGSCAEKLGVKRGWAIEKISGWPTRGKPFRSIVEFFQSEAEVLPKS